MFFNFKRNKVFKIRLNLILILFLTLIFLYSNYIGVKINVNSQVWGEIVLFPPLLDSIIYRSECPCRKNELILVNEINATTVGVYLARNDTRALLYSMSKTNYSQLFFTCNQYSSLRRGQNQKIISYTLFGKKPFYYNRIYNITKQMKQLYPGWLMRIYHDSSIDKSIICQIECQLDEDQHLLDIADFCDLSGFVVSNQGKDVLKPVDYVLPRMWRFFAVGDSFVDLLLSRDSDSYIFQREVDAVNEWLSSDKLFHIIKDHPQHLDPILAGLFGVKVSMDREFGRMFFNLSTDPNVLSMIRPHFSNPKNADQKFLKRFIYPLIKDKSLIHNSYGCEKSGGKPFPTKRIGDCFVGSYVECNQTNEFFECPLKCRPKEHPDWLTC